MTGDFRGPWRVPWELLAEMSCTLLSFQVPYPTQFFSRYKLGLAFSTFRRPSKPYCGPKSRVMVKLRTIPIRVGERFPANAPSMVPDAIAVKYLDHPAVLIVTM